MAQQRPQTLAEFSKISGGQSQTRPVRWAVLRFRLTATSRDSRCKQMPQPLSQPFPQTRSCSLYNYSGKLSVAEIAQQRGFSPSTIINHLLELIEMNQPVDLNHQLVLPVQHLIVKVEAVGTASLKSIYEQESYTYDERLVRAWWQRQKGGKLLAQN